MTLRYDSQHDPAGSVQADLCFSDQGKARITSRELSPRPGYLVDQVFSHEAQCYKKWPVSPIDLHDDELVYVSAGKATQDLDHVIVYEVKKTGSDTLVITSVSNQVLGDSGTLYLRDSLSSGSLNNSINNSQTGLNPVDSNH